MDKKSYYLAGSVGTFIGGYIPVLVGASSLSGWSILGGAVGGIGAILLLYKVSQ
jgi:hypothetical protein